MAALAIVLAPTPAAAAIRFLEEPGSPYAVGNDPYGAVIADFNRDGRPDVAAVNGTSSNLSVLLRRAAGGFSQESPVAVGLGPNHATVGDFNGDGWPDVAVTNFAGNSVTTLLRQPSGGFVPALGSPIGVPNGPSAIASGDFNGDLRPDLAVTRLDANLVRVLLGDPLNPGGFVSGGDFQTGVRPHHLAVGDVNGDGRVDLAVANNGPVNSTAPDTVSILLGQAGGSFAPEVSMPVVPVGDRPLGVVAKDLNGDGRLDLAVANNGSDTVSVLLRKPSNDGFVQEAAPPIATGAGPVGIASADFDGDGRNDLVVSANAGGSLTILRRSGAGGFAADPAISLQRPYWPAPADFNADARPDLALTSDTPGHVRILLNATDADVPPPPIPPPPPVGDPPRNVRVPRITATQVARLYLCDEGAWLNLPANPQFEYRWYHAWSRAFRPLLVSQSSGYLVPRDKIGGTFYCTVTVRNAFGAGTASSAWTVLTGAPNLVPIPIRTRPYGNVRVNGIDLFQTVQPSSGAATFGFPSGAFVDYLGGGTPTNYRQAGIFGPQLVPGTTAQRVDYAGVSLDADKPARAVVYVNMTSAEAASATQPLEVKLTFRVDGRALPPVTKTITKPAVIRQPYVNQTERDDPKYGVQFEVPAYALYAGASAGRLDVEAEVAFPLAAQIRGTHECDVGDCHVDNRFRLDDVPVALLPRLTVLPLELLGRGQTALPSADKVLARARQLFPGGESMLILPYLGRLDVSIEQGLTLADDWCSEDVEFKSVRACRSYYIEDRMARWRVNATGRAFFGTYQILLGAHEYVVDEADGSSFVEPGWTSSGNGPNLAGYRRDLMTPLFTANAGGANRPLTAAAHELGHVFSAPHADTMPAGCGGDSNRQVSEPWPNDNQGRLQGVKFDRSAKLVAGNVDPVIDTDAKPLYDLMSYCAADSNAWLSARNWNRSFQVMVDLGARLRGARALAAQVPEPPAAFATGVLGSSGGRIARVFRADGDDALPPSEPSPSVRLRSLDASGRTLLDAATWVFEASSLGEGGNFLGPVAAQAAVVQLVRDGAVVNSVTRSRPPRVRLLAPRRGSTIRGRSPLVRWAASDPDGDALQATVEYSPNGGRSWRLAYDGPGSTGRARLPGRALSASRAARVRVTVNDGFGEARAVSGRLRAAGTPPSVRIIRPESREALSGEARTLLSGAGVDDRQRPLRRASLAWFVNGRRVGSGEQVRVRLPVGRVRVRLTGRDRQGRRGIAQRTLRVAAPPLRLLELSAPLHVARGARRATIKVRVSAPAMLRIGGRRQLVGPQTRRIAVRLPRRPKAGLLRVPFTIRARGRAADGTLTSRLQILRA